jgi:hypothetical protein
MSLTSIIERGKAQRRYFATAEPGYGITSRLHVTADPAERAELIEALADIDEALASQHTAVWGPDPIEHEGGRDMAVSLASSAELLGHLAFTERSIAAECPAEYMETGGRLWEEVYARFDLYTSVNELMLWVELAATTDRATRAGLIDQIWEYAAERVGGRAAEGLACMAIAEREVAAGGSELPVRFSREGIAAFFVLFGAVLILPTLPGFGDLPLSVRTVIALLASGLVVESALRGLGARCVWSSAWTCKSTGERLGSAAHRRAHTTTHCDPTFWRILPRLDWRNS